MNNITNLFLTMALYYICIGLVSITNEMLCCVDIDDDQKFKPLNLQVEARAANARTEV